MPRCLTVLMLASAALARPAILDAGYPRAFYFRWSEGQANNPRHSDEDFARLVGGLMGIQGKVLDEEVRIDPTRKIARFDGYKAAHPEQLVLLHINGNGRDPGFEGQRFAAGHWLYYEGCAVLDAVLAEPGEAVLRVARPERFRCGVGRLGGLSNEDVGLCALTAEGRPDWSRAEQLQLLATDPAAGTITVRRGAFGTAPLAFEAGRAYVAAHVGEGPWGPEGNRQLLWSYNYATTCPRDAAGRDCSQAWIDHLAELLGPGGVLARFDGLEFDVLWDTPFDLPVYNPLGAARRSDVDADGRGDGGVVGAVNVYGYGVTDFLTRLRARLGDDRLILADGTHAEQQRGQGVLNGIESESFPENTDTLLRGWSDGVNRHLYWAREGRAPAFQYVAHKFVLPQEGRALPPNVHSAPWNITPRDPGRGCLTDAAVAVNSHPPAEPGQPVGVWDELQAGQARRLGWLGRPLGPAERLASGAPDLLRRRRRSRERELPPRPAPQRLRGGVGVRAARDPGCGHQRGSVARTAAADRLPRAGSVRGRGGVGGGRARGAAGAAASVRGGDCRRRAAADPDPARLRSAAARRGAGRARSGQWRDGAVRRRLRERGRRPAGLPCPPAVPRRMARQRALVARGGHAGGRPAAFRDGTDRPRGRA